jgi:hypothetical protein
MSSDRKQGLVRNAELPSAHGTWIVGHVREANDTTRAVKNKKTRILHPGTPFSIPPARLPIHEERDGHHPTGRYSGFRFTLEVIRLCLGRDFMDDLRSRRRVRNGFAPFSPEPGWVVIAHESMIRPRVTLSVRLLQVKRETSQAISPYQGAVPSQRSGTDITYPTP